MKVAGVNVEVRGLWERFEVCQGRIAARHAWGEISAAGTGRRPSASENRRVSRSYCQWRAGSA